MNVILFSCINRSVKNKTPTEPNRISLKGLMFFHSCFEIFKLYS